MCSDMCKIQRVHFLFLKVILESDIVDFTHIVNTRQTVGSPANIQPYCLVLEYDHDCILAYRLRSVTSYIYAYTVHISTT